MLADFFLNKCILICSRVILLNAICAPFTLHDFSSLCNESSHSRDGRDLRRLNGRSTPTWETDGVGRGRKQTSKNTFRGNESGKVLTKIEQKTVCKSQALLRKVGNKSPQMFLFSHFFFKTKHISHVTVVTSLTWFKSKTKQKLNSFQFDHE